MPKPPTISKKEARRLALHCQGLDTKWPYGKGLQATNRVIARLGYTQLDTISVVERAHHHVLWSRVPDYRKSHLKTLQVGGERSIFEYWAHAAAFLPIDDYRYALPTMQYFRDHKDRWPKSKKAVKQDVLRRVKEEGPLMSRDFKHTDQKKGDGWWDWKPAKLALQRLFFEGELMVSERVSFQRVYDLAERVLHSGIDTSHPSDQEYAGFLVQRTIQSHGLATPAAMAYQRKGMQAAVKDRLAALTDTGIVVPVRVSGSKDSYFSTPELLETAGIRINNTMRILSPFDNAVIQRRRLRDLFDYDYQIECYVPELKRQYGYFCLPLLLGDRFVGRIDAKADRKSGTLVLKHVVMERAMDEGYFVQKLAEALPAFMAFNGCDSVVVERVTPDNLNKEIPRVL